MICYFSGTGNSKYVAKRISESLPNEALVDLNDCIKNHIELNKNDCSRIIFVTPTYAWRIPKVVEKYIESHAPFNRTKVYFVMTCGGEIGNAGKYLKQMCSRVGMSYRGVAGVVMPENYIAMFSAPDNDEALKIVDRAESTIDNIIELIRNNKRLPQSDLSLIDRLYSSVVNPVFYTLFVKDKKFYANDKCISCRKCELVCPLNNIISIDGKPAWQGNCTHCMACICSCPTGAIEYGKKSVNQPRYHCPK